MEYWDLYDENEIYSGKQVARGPHVPEGLFHLVVETLIAHEDGTYLVMQRDINKKEMPGLYEGSAGGSVLAGEKSEEGARREVFEETGIEITTLQPTYRHVYKERGSIHLGYITYLTGVKPEIIYQKGETINHKWLTLPELLSFIQTPAYNQKHTNRLFPYLLNQEK